MENLTNPLLLNVYGYLDISSLIKIYKLQLINDFTENEEKRFYKNFLHYLLSQKDRN